MMEWTTVKPSRPGWYWARWPERPQFGAVVLLITQPNGPDTDDLEIDYPPCNETLEEYVAREGPVEWQGPLEPQENA